MSVPGYAYPAFDYTQSEFFNNPGASITATPTDVANGFARTTIAAAEGGDAVFLREASVFGSMSAVVGTRTVSLQLNTPEGAFSTRYNSPITWVANSNATTNWSVGISNAYTLTASGYAPAPQIVIPPGYVWIAIILSPQVGDQLLFVTGIGIKIPTMGVGPSEPEVVPTPLLV